MGPGTQLGSYEMKTRWGSRVVHGTNASRPLFFGRATFRNTARCAPIRGLL